MLGKAAPDRNPPCAVPGALPTAQADGCEQPYRPTRPVTPPREAAPHRSEPRRPGQAGFQDARPVGHERAAPTRRRLGWQHPRQRRAQTHDRGSPNETRPPSERSLNTPEPASTTWPPGRRPPARRTSTQLRRTAQAQGLAVTDYAPAQDTDTITVTKATADKYHLRSIGDLKHVAGRLRVGAPQPLLTVPYGVPGLKKMYGVATASYPSTTPTTSSLPRTSCPC